MNNEESADVFPSKHPLAKLDYGVSFESECARKREKWTDYVATARIRIYQPGNAAGFEFEATTAGRTAGKEPRWPTALGDTVTDGSVVWTACALSDSSLSRTVNGTPTWSADNGVTISGEAINNMIASASIAGGADGSDYAVTVTATLSDGDTIVKTAILPVRIPVRTDE